MPDSVQNRCDNDHIIFQGAGLRASSISRKKIAISRKAVGIALADLWFGLRTRDLPRDTDY